MKQLREIWTLIGYYVTLKELFQMFLDIIFKQILIA